MGVWLLWTQTLGLWDFVCPGFVGMQSGRPSGSTPLGEGEQAERGREKLGFDSGSPGVSADPMGAPELRRLFKSSCPEARRPGPWTPVTEQTLEGGLTLDKAALAPAKGQWPGAGAQLGTVCLPHRGDDVSVATAAERHLTTGWVQAHRSPFPLPGSPP